MQNSQQPQASCSQTTQTGSPSRTRVTPAPVAATMPMASCPGTKGSFGFTGQSPSAACRSVWQTPLAATLTSIWPGPGVGMGTSSITSGAPNLCTTAAFIVFAIALSSTFSYWEIFLPFRLCLSVGPMACLRENGSGRVSPTRLAGSAPTCNSLQEPAPSGDGQIGIASKLSASARYDRTAPTPHSCRDSQSMSRILPRGAETIASPGRWEATDTREIDFEASSHSETRTNRENA